MKRKWQNSSPLEVTAMVRMGHWDKRRDINWFQLKYSLCDNIKLQHERTLFLLFVNGFIDISWWCASRWSMMMLPMVRLIYLVLMMRKVNMSIVLMGHLAPLVVMVSASLLIVENDHRNNFQIQRLPATGDWAPATWLQQHSVFWGHVFGVDDEKDVFEVSVDGSIGTLGPTTWWVHHPSGPWQGTDTWFEGTLSKLQSGVAYLRLSFAVYVKNGLS